MKKVRVIARLDVKAPNLVKGIQLEGLRKLGNPNEYAQKYYIEGIDEIIYMDIVASLYNRNSLGDIIKRTVNNVFVPITVGGGLRTVEDVRNTLKAGADKVAVNTAAIKRPELIKEVSETFGSQCMVLSVEAKKTGDNTWEAYYDNGREKTGISVLEWVQEGVSLGAGEILVTSVDKEGMQKGFDIELIKRISEAVKIPVIASGGMGNIEHLTSVVNDGRADAIAIASVLHYNKMSVNVIKESLCRNDIGVRRTFDV